MYCKIFVRLGEHIRIFITTIVWNRFQSLALLKAAAIKLTLSGSCVKLGCLGLRICCPGMSGYFDAVESVIFSGSNSFQCFGVLTSVQTCNFDGLNFIICHVGRR